MSTTKQQTGADMVLPNYAFIAPNEVFYAPSIQVPTLDGLGTEMITIQEYFNRTDGNRTIVPLKGGTHSFGMFEMEYVLGDFDNNKLNMEAMGFVDGLYDFTLDLANVFYQIPHGRLAEFKASSPLNVDPNALVEPIV